MIATTMLVAPALAAETVKPAPAAAPSVPAAATPESKTDATKPVTHPVKTDKNLKTDAPAKPVTNPLKTDKDVKTDATKPATNPLKPDKDLKTNGQAKPEVKTIKADPNLKSGAAPAAQVATVKGDKDNTTVKVATRHHRHHSHHWYMVHRGSHMMTAKASTPVKPADVHKARKEDTHEVKTNKVPSNKPSS